MTLSRKIHISEPEDMIRLGETIGRLLFPGAVIGLIGPLGAGKTTLVRGIASGMGIEDGYIVSSPTFTLLQNYPCQSGELWHLDLYRISGEEDLDSTGYRDSVDGARVLIVEWADRQPQVLPEEHLAVTIGYEPDGRTVTLDPKGGRYRSLVSGLVTGGGNYPPGGGGC
ncbi:MAG: tRNA (adenosine(37)-N6)-threonylcarbamoyltransferase complex ATPase subunit type 1 TsaE [bacterium]|nr:MAG: tRNA (adenosine(37)-N6)-threonylcarbamoyltransferase complex ATPase subunit type 1 TsaE [bacterium]